MFPRSSVLVLSLLVSACSGSEQPMANQVPSGGFARHQLSSLVLTSETTAEELVFEGMLEADYEATLASQTNSRVDELPFDVGDYVEKDQIIVRLRAKEQRARAAGAQASVHEAEARLAEAQSAFDRARELSAQGVLSKASLDKATAALNSARAQFQAASASVNDAGEQAEHTLIRAPYDSIIVSRHIAVGESVIVGRPLITVLSLEHLRAVVEVPQQAIGIVRARKQARVILPDGSSEESVQLRLPPSADSQSHTFRVLVALPRRQYEATGQVSPGTLVKVAFVGDQHRVLLLPETAIIRRSELTAVYVLDGDKPPELRYVLVGSPVKDGRLPVLAGVTEGDRIALDALDAARRLKGGA